MKFKPYADFYRDETHQIAAKQFYKPDPREDWAVYFLESVVRRVICDYMADGNIRPMAPDEVKELQSDCTDMLCDVIDIEVKKNEDLFNR